MEKVDNIISARYNNIKINGKKEAISAIILELVANQLNLPI
jgi:hypothetical protein